MISDDRTRKGARSSIYAGNELPVFHNYEILKGETSIYAVSLKNERYNI